MNTKKILHLLSRDARLLSKSLVVLVLILSVCNPVSMAVADSNNADKNPTFPGLTQPILPFEGFQAQLTDPCELDPDKSYRGIAFLSSNINNTFSLDEIRNFVSDCNLDFVVIDFAWITGHWDETDLAAVAQLAAELVNNGVQVAAMYRPRALSPNDAPIHYAKNCDGTIDPSHNHLCFAYEDSVAWGAQWGIDILNALPSIDKVIVYNLLAPCCCQLCQGGQGAVYAEQFMERCRLEWEAVCPGVQVGHVGIGAEYADQVDFFCPFLIINREDDNPVDVNALLDDLITPGSQPGNKPVIPLAKICWDGATDNTTEDIINTIEACENRQTGFVLWYYDWIFYSGRYDPYAIAEALGDQWNPTNPPYSWVYFESKESIEGQPPVLALTLGSGNQDIPIDQDTCLISYLPDGAWGMLSMLAISMDDTNRDLLAFSLSGIDPGAILQSAQLVLDMKQSDVPTVAPFDLAVHIVTEPWSEYTATWNNQPAFETDPCVIVSIDPNPGLKVIDITGIVSNWLTEAIPNYGILLKVAEAVPEIPDLTFPYEEHTLEPLPWSHQAPWLTPQEIESLNEQVWVINDFPLYQADEQGSLRYYHGGLDIVLDNGTPIYAMKDGWVKVKSTESPGFYSITIADAAGAEPSYGWEYTHLSNFQVDVGDFVTEGTFIGQVDFPYLGHIHLSKVFSEAPYWGSWRYMCMPNGHFTYIDEEPPDINTPFYFFENNSDTEIQPDGAGDIVLTGQVDIVVAMREQGLYARSNDSGFGDRLGITKIVYEIRPAGLGPASGLLFQSFDFNDIKIKSGASDPQYNTDLTRIVYKHWILFEPERTSGHEALSYYIITNCSGRQSPQELDTADRDYCWDTAVLDQNGLPLFPDGAYDIIVTAYDFDGHSSSQTMSVILDNQVDELLVPGQFPTIQAAVDVAGVHDIVVVADGTYTGPGNRDINFAGKAVTVRSADGPENCIIDCQGTGLEPHRAFYFYNGEGPDSVVDGFTITNGYHWLGGAILCEYSSPTITNCVFHQNAAEWYGGAMENYDSSPVVSNCIFSGNRILDWGNGGAIDNDGSSPTITNCTFHNNSADYGGAIYDNNPATTVTNSILWANNAANGPQIYGNCSVSYCNVQGGFFGDGNIDADPNFVDADNNDCHLRWHSPCIDAGDPAYVPQPDETDIDGEPRMMKAQLDMGADEVGEKQADFTRDGAIDMLDLKIFVEAWLSSPGDHNWYVLCDLYEDLQIDFSDFTILAGDWLWGQ